MKGGVYTEEVCPICRDPFKDTSEPLACPVHPKCRATHHRVIFESTTKRFKSYDAANRFLTGIRLKTDAQTFDLGYRRTVDKDTCGPIQIGE